MRAERSEWGLEVKEKLPSITKGDFFVLGGVIKRRYILGVLIATFNVSFS